VSEIDKKTRAPATGAGAGAMNAIGTAVTGGMLSATFIDLVFIPMFFVLISQILGRKRHQTQGTETPSEVGSQTGEQAV